MTSGRGDERLWKPLWDEFCELRARAVKPRDGLKNALAPEEYTADGLAEIGAFCLRWEVSYCLDQGIKELDRVDSLAVRGRPKVPELETKDARRSYLIWEMVQNLGSATPAIRDLIGAYQRMEHRRYADFPERILFSTRVSFATLEQSVSRGKKALGIDENWKSPLCEKIRDIYRKRHAP